MRILLLTIALATTLVAQQKPGAPPSVRLYILDCGIIVAMNPESYFID